ncbi:MAG TPA: phosphatidylglycerol lysyltransferase domain-containing protein [Acetobacteraceae bacterium]|nr:phosphatidylglycerol lysyltransferase domain-containing protein [Acetobacteraceae bacterium]
MNAASLPDRLPRWWQRLPALLGVLLLVAAVIAVRAEFRRLSFADIARSVEDTPAIALAAAAVWTVVSYAVLTLYDRLGTIYAGKRVSYRRAAFASFCAYALSHNLGFPAVSGAAVRYRFYAHWGLTPAEIARVVGFCSFTFGLGGLVIGGVVLVFEPRAVPALGSWLPLPVLHGAGVAFWAIVLLYVLAATLGLRVRVFGATITLPDARMAVLQVGLATVDVALTAAVFFALLPAAPGLGFLRFLGVYVSCFTAGLVASLPGGIGVFDGAMLLGLAPYLPAPRIVGAILLFRLYYYIVPLLLAGSLFAASEVLLRRGERWSEPDFAVAASTGIVALCGAALLSLGVLQPASHVAFADPDVAAIAATAGRYVPSLIGTALMLLAAGLARRVTLAWWLTMALLPLAAVTTAAEGQPAWLPGVLLLAACLLAPLRRACYRHARLTSGPFDRTTALPLLALVVCVLALAATRPAPPALDADSWWRVVLSPLVPNGMRLAVALSVGLGLAAGWRLIRPARVRPLPWDAAARRRYAALGRLPAIEADGLLLGEAGRAALAFRHAGPVLLALGDPVGAAEDRVSAIWRLRDLARQEGLDPAIWQAGPALLDIYRGLGLAAVPLDSEGRPLDPRLQQPGTGRYLCCVAERDLALLLPLLDALAARPGAA